MTVPIEIDIGCEVLGHLVVVVSFVDVDELGEWLYGAM